jgi:CheY-like chemotaxis protein
MARILLIDDDPAVRRTLVTMLVSAGHEVAPYASGKAALAAADRLAFDLVLTDVLMPDMDGLEVMRGFARRVPRPKVIAMTGGSLAPGIDLLAIASSLGADGVIAKPMRAAELAATIAAVLASP